MELLKAFEVTDWSAAKLADETGTHRSTITRIATNKRTASLGLALRIERITTGLVRAEDLPLTEQARNALQLIRDAAA